MIQGLAFSFGEGVIIVLQVVVIVVLVAELVRSKR